MTAFNRSTLILKNINVDAENLGLGIGTFTNKEVSGTNINLQFRSITGDSNIQIYESGNTIYISGTTAGVPTTASNGLSIQSGNVVLGGVLTGNTSICTNNAYGVSIGHNNVSSGINSFAQGSNTIASGSSSHAEGSSSCAIGIFSHAEGSGTRAIGGVSHTEGFATIASGSCSHAEGSITSAIGASSHSEGSITCAIGNWSHTGGRGCTSGDRYIVACGLASFNHSFNTTDQIAGHGANAGYSAIVGGRDHNIESGNTRAAIIGGNAIKLTGTTYVDTTAVSNLAIISGLTENTGSTQVLVRNTSTGVVGYVDKLSFASSGLTTNPAGSNTEIQYNDNGSFGSDVNFTFSGSTNSLTLGTRQGASGNFSFVQGCNNIASGDYSHAEGFNTNAIGCFSHAEGGPTFDKGGYPSILTTASGNYSHAEGIGTCAVGTGSHSEGCLTCACGTGSHAEGFNTMARVLASHSEGCLTCAYGGASHAEGFCTFACGEGSHVEGVVNSACGCASHAEGSSNIASGNFSHAEGNRTRAIGTASHAGGCGNYTVVTDDRFIFACGCASFNHSFNDLSQIAGHGANANQSAILGGINHNIESGNTRAAIIGGSGIKLTGTTYIDTTAVSNLAIISGLTENTGSTQVLVRNTSTGVVGYVDKSSLGVTSAENGLSIQSGNVVLGGTLTGDTSICTNNAYGVSIGHNNVSSGINSFAQGSFAYTYGNNSFVGGGYFTCAINNHDVALGSFSTASGGYSIAIGGNASGYFSCAFGGNACGANSLAIGGNAIVDNSRAFGGTACGIGSTSIRFGNANVAVGDNSLTIGSGARSYGEHSMVIGVGLNSNQRYLIASGACSINISRTNASHIAFEGSNANYSTILGGYNHNIESGNTNATIVGGKNISLTGTNYIDATAVGKLALISGLTENTGSTQVLVRNTSTGIIDYVDKSSLGGSGSTTNPAGSNTEIQYNNNGSFGSDVNFTFSGSTNSLTLGTRCSGYSSGNYSFVLGINSVASNTNSLSIGSGNRVIGCNSFVQGNDNKAIGCNSFAQGNNSCATGSMSHAEGQSYSLGFVTHSEGSSTIACGQVSHAQGCQTLAYGRWSHSGGKGYIGGKEILSEGDSSFNHSFNDSGQTAGHGALAGYSAILGGTNHNIESGNIRAAIIGGNAIKLTGTTYVDTTAVSNLAIISGLTENTGSTEVLVRNTSTGIIGYVDKSSLGGSGSTTNPAGSNTEIQYNDNGSFGSDINLRFSGSTNSLTVGCRSSSVAEGVYSLGVGRFVTSTGCASVAMGCNTNAINHFALAHGLFANACGCGSSAIGIGVIASGDTSHAQNNSTCAYGNNSHAEGLCTIANGAQSHSEGNTTRSIGINSHAEGSGSIASGSTSHAEGYCTRAIRDYTHAEGFCSYAYGQNSHAEGDRTFTFGASSHAEGSSTIASGASSHAEGAGTRAIGNFSHAQGCASRAYGNTSHVGGSGLASGNKQIFACGSTSFNHSRNTTSQIAGHGANAGYSAILGGENHNIESGNIRAAIIGGNAIKLTGTTYVDTTAVGNLAIMTSPSLNNASNEVLVRNTSTGIIGYVDKSSLGGSGSTTNPAGSSTYVQINGEGEFSASTYFRFVPNTRSLTVGTRAAGAQGLASIAIGSDVVASGEQSIAQGRCAVASGSRAISMGHYTTAGGNYSSANGWRGHAGGCASHAQNFYTCAIGFASHAGGHGHCFSYTVSCGFAAFNHSMNTNPGQTAGHGANACTSAILGGRNHNIESGNIRAAIIGGDAIKLTGTTYVDTTAMSCAAIFMTPADGGSNDVLTWNPTTKKIGKVTQVSISDERLKTCIENISNVNLTNIRGVRFEYNEKTPRVGTKAYGVIAQEVEKSFPLLVKENYEIGKEKYKTVDYKQLVPILLEKVKELEQRIIILEQKN